MITAEVYICRSQVVCYIKSSLTEKPIYRHKAGCWSYACLQLFEYASVSFADVLCSQSSDDVRIIFPSIEYTSALHGHYEADHTSESYKGL